MNWEQLCDICDKITHGQMEPVRGEHQKPGLYLQREHVRQQFETFLANREQHGFVLVGTSGVGKSNFLLALSEELRTRKRIRGNNEERSVCVLMYDAGNMDVSSRTIEAIINEDFKIHPSGRKVHEVWPEIDKIDGIDDRQVVFCVDAINENPETPKLLRELNELMRDCSGWLKIVFSCRRETWRSIRSGGSGGRGVKLAERYYREQGFAEVELEPFSCEEFKDVYARYQREYELETPYESLSNEMRETLRDPLNLWLVADMCKREKKAVPKTVKVSVLIDLYVSALQDNTVPERILEKKDRRFLEEELVPLMVGSGHYSNDITDDDLYATGGALYDNVFSREVLPDGRRKNESFLRLVDADILVQKNLGAGNVAIKFKHERFYEHFAGKRIASLSETQADRYAFFLELIEEIAGNKEATDETKTTSKPFLWGAVRNALVEEARNSNSETILKLCRTTEQRVKEMMVNLLVTLGREEQVDGILKRLLPQEKEASEVQKLRRVMRKAAKESAIAFRHAGRIAIEVASTLGITWVLQEASLREDPSLRTEAVRYSYYLWQRDWQRDRPEAAFAVLEYVAAKATAGVIPDSRAFESVFGLSVIIFFEHHKDAEVLNSLQRIWSSMIATFFRIHEGSSPWKARVGDFIRDRIVGFVISLAFRLFSLLPSYNMVSYEALEHFSTSGLEKRHSIDAWSITLMSRGSIPDRKWSVITSKRYRSTMSLSC